MEQLCRQTCGLLVDGMPNTSAVCLCHSEDSPRTGLCSQEHSQLFRIGADFLLLGTCETASGELYSIAPLRPVKKPRCCQNGVSPMEDEQVDQRTGAHDHEEK